MLAWTKVAAVKGPPSSYNKYFLNSYWVPDTTQGGGDTVKSKANETLVLKMTSSKREDKK